MNEWKLLQGSVPKDISRDSDQWSTSYETESRVKSERIDSIVYKILQKGKENQILIFLKRRE